jgi:hypothetical protein
MWRRDWQIFTCFKGAGAFETSGTTRPRTRRNIPQHWTLFTPLWDTRIPPHSNQRDAGHFVLEFASGWTDWSSNPSKRTFYHQQRLQWVKVKLSHYRPGQALRVSGGWEFQNFYTIDICKLPGCQLYASSAFTPRANGWPQGLSQWKIKITPSGTETATFRLVVNFNRSRGWVPRGKAAGTWRWKLSSIYCRHWDCSR